MDDRASQVGPSQQPFYEKLPTKDHFRLLCLGHQADHPKLAVTTLKDCPPFSAISYCWSESHATEVLEGGSLNGFLVSKHVKQLLAAMQPGRYETCNLWIDAICINQADLAERNHQIKVMKKIYSSSQGVVVWLGADVGESMYQKQPRATSELVHPDRPRSAQSENAALAGKIVMKGKHVWWRRVWVYQECAVARSIHVQFGTKSMYWNTFIEIMRREASAQGLSGDRHDETTDQQDLTTIRSVYDSLIAIRNLRAYYQATSSGMSLRHLLLSTSTAYSSLAVDKIYALLGLRREQGPGIDADYGRSVEVVYLEVLFAIIAEEGLLDILVDGWPSLLSCGLSWLPDFSNVDQRQPTLPSPGPYRAAKTRRTFVDLRTSSSSPSSLLDEARLLKTACEPRDVAE